MVLKLMVRSGFQFALFTFSEVLGGVVRVAVGGGGALASGTDRHPG